MPFPTHFSQRKLPRQRPRNGCDLLMRSVGAVPPPPPPAAVSTAIQPPFVTMHTGDPRAPATSSTAWLESTPRVGCDGEVDDVTAALMLLHHAQPSTAAATADFNVQCLEECTASAGGPADAAPLSLGGGADGDTVGSAARVTPSPVVRVSGRAAAPHAATAGADVTKRARRVSVKATAPAAASELGGATHVDQTGSVGGSPVADADAAAGTGHAPAAAARRTKDTPLPTRGPGERLFTCRSCAYTSESANNVARHERYARGAKSDWELNPKKKNARAVVCWRGLFGRVRVRCWRHSCYVETMCCWACMRLPVLLGVPARVGSPLPTRQSVASSFSLLLFVPPPTTCVELACVAEPASAVGHCCRFPTV